MKKYLKAFSKIVIALSLITCLCIVMTDNRSHADAGYHSSYSGGSSSSSHSSSSSSSSRSSSYRSSGSSYHSSSSSSSSGGGSLAGFIVWIIIVIMYKWIDAGEILHVGEERL